MSTKNCIRIWLRVGHNWTPTKSAPDRFLPYDWRLWVRGVSEHDISTFVHKVVFYLHPSSLFMYPKRVCQEPPYEIEESGLASIDASIRIYLKFNESKKIRLNYSLEINDCTKSNSEWRCVYCDFEDPPEQLWKALMLGGGKIIKGIGTAPELLLCDDGKDETRKNLNKKKPDLSAKSTQCNYGSNLKEQLRDVSMTEDEIVHVSRLCNMCIVYEQSEKKLTLPPQSDSIYQLPELPPALQEALKGMRFDGQWL